MNPVNEASAWDADFSYGYLKNLYGRLTAQFQLGLIGDWPSAVGSGRPRALLRHDVDVSLDRALAFAEQEQSWGVAATYHVMLDSPLYDTRSPRSAATMKAISAMGHEIGLHYDVIARGTDTADADAREQAIDAACRALEDIVQQPVRSLSFHRPIPEVLRGPLRIAGRISANGAELCRWYLSDSRGRWREGNPIDSLARPRGEPLQILIHPIWWGWRHQPPAERLREFLLDELGGAPRPQHYQKLRTTLFEHILHDAANL